MQNADADLVRLGGIWDSTFAQAPRGSDASSPWTPLWIGTADGMQLTQITQKFPGTRLLTKKQKV